MKYCLIGEKLGHSYSKVIHELQGLNYSLVEIPKDKLDEFVKDCPDGFNVTIPYKKEIIRHLDGLDDSASTVGAVNTVLKRDGKLYGYNTDVFGMEYALKRAEIDLEGKTVLILGSGGTSLTARAVCEKLNARQVFVVSRSGEINYENCYGLGAEVIINTTPVGMYPNVDETAVDLARFNNLTGVFDCVYNPLRTNLILEAQKLGIKCSGGLPMLVAQGLKAEEIWLNKEVPSERYESVIRTLENQKRNIVLIGMPSCGKTSVANALAKVLGKPVFDTDQRVFKNEGKTPSEIILSQGETAFREKESVAVSQVAKESGVIIATGGGAILKCENVKALKRNGVLIYLERALEKLVDDDRPLSKNGAISRLFEQRKPIYESVCDKKVSNDGDIGDTVKEILSL